MDRGEQGPAGDASAEFAVHQVKTPLSNSYVVRHGERLLVVDVGAGCHEYVLGFIEQELGFTRSAVALIVCTHDDFDHLGGVRHLAAACECPFALPYASRSARKKQWNNPTGWLLRLGTGVLESVRPRAWRMYFDPRRLRRVRGRPRSRVRLSAFEVAQQRPTHRLKDGGQLPGFSDWSVIHTPGHTWDSCCFYNSKLRALISGDTLLGSRAKQRLVRPAILSSRAQIRRSIQALAQLDVEHVYPGHGLVMHGDGLLANLQ